MIKREGCKGPCPYYYAPSTDLPDDDEVGGGTAGPLMVVVVAGPAVMLMVVVLLTPVTAAAAALVSVVVGALMVGEGEIATTKARWMIIKVNKISNFYTITTTTTASTRYY